MKASCAQVRVNLSGWLDGATSREQAGSIEAHLLDCPGCRAERAALEGTRVLIHSAGRVRAPRRWQQEAVRAATTPGAPERRGRARPGAMSRIGAFWVRPAAFSSAAVVLLAGVSLYLILLRPSALEPVAPGLQSETATESAKAHPPPVAMGNSPRAQASGPAPSSAPSGSQAHVDEEQGSAREEWRAKEKAASPPAVKLSSPPAGVATGFAPVRPDALAKRENDVTAREITNAEPLEAPTRLLRITLAQIRFPAPHEHEEMKSSAPRIAAEPAAPPSPNSPTAAGALRQEFVRVLVVLDSGGRVLSARAAEVSASPETTALVARLNGATIDPATLPSPGPTAGEMVLEIELKPRADR